MHSLVELWAWERPGKELCDRSDSPWDDAARRPSHANRRQALRRQILRQELPNITTTWSLPDKIMQLAESLMALATKLNHKSESAGWSVCSSNFKRRLPFLPMEEFFAFVQIHASLTDTERVRRFRQWVRERFADRLPPE